MARKGRIIFLETGCEDFDDLEFHLVFHDAPTIPATDLAMAYYPQAFDFFYHIMFEEVNFDERMRERLGDDDDDRRSRWKMKKLP